MSASTFTEHDWYDTPTYYDIVFAADTPLECDFLEGILQRYGKTRGKNILEPACGSGRLVESMAARGYAVTGFDKNQAMLDYAKARLEKLRLRANLAYGAMESFSYKQRFDLAHCLVSTFKYLLDESAAHSHLQCVADSLKVGGLYALGFHLSDYEDTRCSRERWFGQRDGLSVTCNIQSWPADKRSRLEAIRSRLVVRKRSKTQRTETHWQFRTYNVAQMKRLLRSVAAFEHVGTYDFTYNLNKPRAFDDNQLDTLLVLRRK